MTSLRPSRNLLRAALALAVATALLIDGLTPAQARTGTIDLTAETSGFLGTSDSFDALSDGGFVGTPGLSVGYGATDFLDVYVGFRMNDFTGDSVAGRSMELRSLFFYAGTRFRLPLAGDWLSAYVQLDIEAQLSELDLSFDDGRHGSQTSWSGGLVPKAGIEAAWRFTEGFGMHVRLGGGYAFRLDTSYDAVGISGDGTARGAALDLGNTNLSGAVVGLSFGFTFL